MKSIKSMISDVPGHPENKTLNVQLVRLKFEEKLIGDGHGTRGRFLTWIYDICYCKSTEIVPVVWLDIMRFEQLQHKINF